MSRSPSLVFVAILAVLTAAAVNLPLVYLFLRAAQQGVSGYASVVFSTSTARLTVRTLGLVFGVVATATPLAVTLAWVVTRTDLPGRRFWAATAALPLVFPSYVAALTFVASFGPRGYLQRLLEDFGIERLPDFAYGFSGALLVLTLYTYPYIFLLTVAGLRSLDATTEEASRSLGCGRWRTFFSAVLPQLLPAMAPGALLVTLYTLADFGAVSIVRYNTFTMAIYNAYQALFDRSIAASLATVLVVLTASFIVLEIWFLSHLRPARLGASRPARAIPLGKWRGPVMAGVAGLSLINVWVPVAVLLSWSVRGLGRGSSVAEAGWSALNSLGVALPTAVLAVALSLPIAVWAVRVASIPARVTQALSFAGYALPGLVVGLALVFVTLRLIPVLYQSLTILTAAYVIRFLPEAISASRSSLATLAPTFEEAAKALGGSPWRVFRTVTLPLIKPGLLAGSGLVFLTTMKELPATLILRPTGFDTLATVIWSAASEGIYSRAALPAICLLAVSFFPVYLLIIRPSLRESPS
ncbi:MAG: iron ABC transporter permease [Acidobacteriota bacterium]|nr:iron ABC transporter permease [Acidobacteriota bacterium]